MKTAFKKSFARDLRRITDRAILQGVHGVIQDIEAAQRTIDIKNLRKLAGEKQYYRLKLGDYRLGLIIDGDTVTFVRILHRREIYRYFP